MDCEKELKKLQSEFKECHKLLTAIGDETRQYLMSVMIMGECDGERVIDIAEKCIFRDRRFLTICKY